MIGIKAPSAVTAGLEAPRRGSSDELLKACREFEAILLAKVFRAMRESVEESPDSLGANAVWDAFLDLEVARSVCRGCSLGIAEALNRRLEPAGYRGDLGETIGDESGESPGQG